MNKQFIHKLEERLLPLIKRIEQLEQTHSVLGITAIEHQSAEVDALVTQLEAFADHALQAGSAFSRTVEKKLQPLAERLELLPHVPRIEILKFAQGILAQNPLVLVTEHILNEELKRRQLTRIFLMEHTGVPRFDYRFEPSLHPTLRNLDLNTTEVMIDPPVPSPALEMAWSEFQRTIHGRYVVAADLALVQFQLAVTARRNGLPVPVSIGYSLLDLLLPYMGVEEPISYRIGGSRLVLAGDDLNALMEREEVVSFQDNTQTPADQRALHLLSALRGIADGTFLLTEGVSSDERKG